MKKNVLVISSSPRIGGNSDLLCDEFIKGAMESGNDVDKVNLEKLNINYCTGCGACNEKQGYCSQKDDANIIVKKMIEADVIVMATPVYFYSISAQMKTLIDRCCSSYTKISNKEFYFIISAAEDDIKMMSRTIEDFRGFTDCLDSPIEKGIIYGVGAWKKGDIKGSDAMIEAYNMGKSV